MKAAPRTKVRELKCLSSFILTKMLQARDIRFSYSGPVLKGVSLDVGGGELLCVLGPNGSGKSTLLKIIVGILDPESGAVSIAGRELSSIKRRERAQLVGYVAQESVVRFPLTALEFVLQGRFAQGRLLGFESERDLREAEWAMRMTETVRFASRLVSELSGGERQRVMLARAIASRPRLLVLDEPVANLDVSHQVKMLDLVRRLTIDESLSAIVVTHELNLAAEFASRVLLLKSGEVVACGAPREVMTEANLETVFDAQLLVDENPSSGAPRITLINPQISAISRQVKG
ncbi:MAG TPA: ABC transporter ATP-binding protein [Blastocatellia bacterium]|nr:ABC transporter ATP-binding protein [Blastocatellia bacterium]